VPTITAELSQAEASSATISADGTPLNQVTLAEFLRTKWWSARCVLATNARS
jgi:hypothetical protein